ncbi:orotate phosphoribosyltransferase [Cochleicola gelatinilyticus]|uniref:Orotate phosphoribosyltransferase n=1 Tax=Cochleicola gelatinilyticus TaxID=1763537 RepID=A0A167F4W9_9FLAO|nr:orotate phosphoribosyltransferase [Cochleicola gelatinilyticus]OAB76197.1 orotate phosphoribosyltransferase [Cochleicola gelatinilyticus]
MKLNSKKVLVKKSAEDLCVFLSDVKNFKQLMPENTSKFEVINEKAFVFALKGMPEIALEVKEVNSPNSVILGAMSDKLPFTLTADITPIDETSSEVELLFEGEFNSMMAMMIKSPISKFIGTLSEKMSTL